MIGTATREERDAQERMQEGATSIEAPANGLGRYARWQIKDFMMQKASILALLAVLLMYPLVAGVFNVSPKMQDFAREMKDKWLYVMFGILAPLGTLMATRGIVSEDRQQGFHRFLFAKPINLVRFYAQSLAVNFAGVMAVLGLIAVLYAAIIGPVAILPAFVPAAVFFVLFGGVTFLFSTLSRIDWVWTIGLVAVSAWTQFLVDYRKWTFLAPLKAVLLPVGSFGRMVAEWMELAIGGGSLANAVMSTIHPLTYGLVAFGAGLWLLRQRAVTR